MALQTIPGGLWIPAPSQNITGAPAFQALTAMTAATHQTAFIFSIPKAGNITKIGFRIGTVTAGAGSTLTVTLQTVSTTNGDPTGTAYKGAAAGTSGTGLASNTWVGPITLGTQATNVVAGDIVAAVVTYGTFTAADSIPLTGFGGATSTRMQVPYGDYFNGATWAKALGSLCALDVEYSDGSYAVIQGNFPITTITNQSFASNTAGTNDYALSFQIPFPARLRGVGLFCDRDGDADISLYSGTTIPSGGTIITDKDIRGSTGNGFEYYEFPTPQVLAANTVYRVSVEPTTTTAIILPLFTVSSAAAMDGLDGGQNFRLGKRLFTTPLDSTAWAADVTTQRPAISLYFDQFDDGVQTGALMINPGMDGGFNG